MKNIKTLTSVSLLALLLSFQAYADTEVDEQATQIAPVTSELSGQQQDVVADPIEDINQEQEIANEQINPHEDTVTGLIVQDPQETDDVQIKKAKANAKIIKEQEESNDPLAEKDFDKFSNSNS